MTARCPKHRAPLEMHVLPGGRVVASCVKCDRRAARRCIDCGRDLRPSVQRVRCRRCRLNYHQRKQNAARARDCKHCGAPITIGSKRQYCNDTCRNTARCKRWTKKYWRDRAFRERKRERGRTWRHSLAGIRSYLKQKRKARLNSNGGYRCRESYLAAQRRANERRAVAKREYQHRYRVYGPEHWPACATCGAPIPWNCKGRPRKYCPPCHPWRRS